VTGAIWLVIELVTKHKFKTVKIESFGRNLEKWTLELTQTVES